MTVCFCYIVECSDGTYYTGWTTDPERRLTAHNKGRGAKYTKMRRPVKLVYVEEMPDRTTAMKRENAIKKLGREGKEKLVWGGNIQENRKIRRQGKRPFKIKKSEGS